MPLTRTTLTAGLALVIAAAAPTETQTRRTGLASATKGMVSSAHPLATEAGLEILRVGGNAFDAAVAVAAALNVVEPAMSGAGGYGTILLHHAATHETWFLNPSGRIPAGVNSDAFRAPAPDYMANRRGAKSVSTPGNVHAWEAMSTKYGRLRWQRLLGPAIRLAAEGYALEPRDAELLAEVFDGFPAHAQAIYGRDAKPLVRGQRLRQVDLATSLRTIAEEGAAAFYTGRIAQAIDAAMKEAGGFLTLADLAADQAEWRAPISIPYRGVEVVTASPPANAFDYLVRLGIMSRFDNARLGHNSVDYLHRFAEATKHGFWVRLRHAGDPDIAPPPVDELLSEAYWRAQADGIDPTRAKPFVPPGLASSGSALTHTTHFVVADRDGNVVSATQTLGGLFGSRIMPAGTGIWLNDSLEFSTFEPKGNPMDAHAGRRKLSGDCPTILMRDGRPWVALGTPGGHTIGQTVPQMVMNMVDFRMNVHRALAAPRISFAQPDVRRGLEARGHKLRVVRGLGNAHGLAIEYDSRGRIRRITGAADPRGAGLAKGVN
jgi:gamma-glutamyltranspeptidase/glutathione hydrolase